MNYSGKRRRHHKNDYSSDYSEELETINNIIPPKVVDKQEAPFHPELKLILEKGKSYSLKSKKGHFTYYSDKIFSKGIFYFEVEIISTHYNMQSYIKSKIGNNSIKKQYYEEKLKNIGHYSPTVRIGIIQEGSDYEIPIGSLKNSYSYRSIDGFLLQEGRYIKGNPTFKTKDVVGCLIHLKPPKPKFLLGIDNNEINLEDKCYMKFYLNGKELTQKIEDIKEGDYHLGITLYNFAEAKVNFDYDNMKYYKSINNNIEINSIF